MPSVQPPGPYPVGSRSFDLFQGPRPQVPAGAPPLNPSGRDCGDVSARWPKGRSKQETSSLLPPCPSPPLPHLYCGVTKAALDTFQECSEFETGRCEYKLSKVAAVRRTVSACPVVLCQGAKGSRDRGRSLSPSPEEASAS